MEGAASTPTEPVTPAESTDQKTEGKQDLTEFYNKARNTGIETATKRFNKQLFEQYGVNSIDELSEIVDKSKKTKTESTELQQVLQNRNTQLAEVETERKILQQRLAMSSELNKPFVRAKDPELLRYKLDNQFNFDNSSGQMIVKNKNGEPVIDFKTGQNKTFESIIAEMQADKLTSFLFSEVSGITPNAPTGNSVDSNLRTVTKEELSDFSFQRAIKSSGQWSKVMSGQPVNIEAITRKM